VPLNALAEGRVLKSVQFKSVALGRLLQTCEEDIEEKGMGGGTRRRSTTKAYERNAQAPLERGVRGQREFYDKIQTTGIQKAGGKKEIDLAAQRKKGPNSNGGKLSQHSGLYDRAGGA